MRSSPDDIDLGSLGRAIKKSMPRVALLALLAGGATAGVMMTMAPRYTSQATIEILSREQIDPSRIGKQPGPSPQTDPVSASAMNTHVRNILSTDLTQKMSEALSLAARPEFNDALPADDLFTRTLQNIGLAKAKSTETDADRVLAAYKSAMKVSNIRETRNIQLEFTTPDPAFSAEGANLLAKLYRDSLSSSRTTEISDTERKLGTEKERLEREVATADKAITELRSKADIYKTQTAQGASTTQNDERMGQLTAEQSKAAAARIEAEARAAAARDQLRLGTAESNPDVQKSQMIPRLVEQRIRQERQVTELSTSLMPGHPRMRQVQGDLTSLQKQIKDEVKKVVDGLERDAKTAAEKEANISKQIGGIKVDTEKKGPDDAKLKALEDTGKAKRAELERVKLAYEEARTQRMVGPSVEVRLVQEAKPSNEKVAPKPGMFAPLVTLAMLLVGLAWSVTKAIVMGPPAAGGGGTDRSGSRVELEQISMPTAAALVAAPAGAAAAAARTAASTPAAIAKPQPAVAKPTPRSNIDAAVAALVARDASGACRTLVAGDRADVDAASEALALAKALAADGKSVVLVDWSSAASSLNDHAGGAPTPGLAQLIQGDAAFEDVIQKLADTEAHFVPSGEALSDQSVIFDADRANLVLDAMDEAFEHIIVFADQAAARDLFEATQGRFDTGVLVTETAVGQSDGNVFLGFDVADMAVHRVVRASTATTPPAGSSLLRRGSARTATRPADAQARA
jgi:polysaccharide biosynthesis transport protein